MSACKVQTMRDLASVVIVGENMKNATGTAGKLFNALGRNNINIVAMNQGSSETSITVVLEKKNIKKALIKVGMFTGAVDTVITGTEEDRTGV